MSRSMIADQRMRRRRRPDGRRNESGITLTLAQVSGDACYPGTVKISRTGDREATLEVTREGET